MAKRIDRSRIDAGKFELPRRLAFLVADKVDFDAVIDNDGEFSVVISAAALRRLAKAKADLKTLKGDIKKTSSDAASALNAEKETHEATRDALAKAERRIKALEKKLNQPAAPARGVSAPEPTPAPAPAAPATENPDIPSPS